MAAYLTEREHLVQTFGGVLMVFSGVAILYDSLNLLGKKLFAHIGRERPSELERLNN